MGGAVPWQMVLCCIRKQTETKWTLGIPPLHATGLECTWPSQSLSGVTLAPGPSSSIPPLLYPPLSLPSPETIWTAQQRLSCWEHSCPDPNPRVSLNQSQHSPHLWSAGAHEGICPADPELQDLHYTGQQQYIQEEPKSRNWRPRTRPMTFCNEHWQVKIYGQRDKVWHIVSYYIFHDEIFKFFTFLFYLFFS